jgi:hypothetical protein
MNNALNDWLIAIVQMLFGAAISFIIFYLQMRGSNAITNETESELETESAPQIQTAKKWNARDMAILEWTSALSHGMAWIALLMLWYTAYQLHVRLNSTNVLQFGFSIGILILCLVVFGASELRRWREKTDDNIRTLYRLHHSEIVRFYAERIEQDDEQWLGPTPR